MADLPMMIDIAEEPEYEDIRNKIINAKKITKAEITNGFMDDHLPCRRGRNSKKESGDEGQDRDAEGDR